MCTFLEFYFCIIHKSIFMFFIFYHCHYCCCCCCCCCCYCYTTVFIVNKFDDINCPLSQIGSHYWLFSIAAKIHIQNFLNFLFSRFREGVKIIHFIGPAKPWLQPFDTETRLARVSGDSANIGNYVQLWWDLFCTHVHPHLSTCLLYTSRCV